MLASKVVVFFPRLRGTEHNGEVFASLKEWRRRFAVSHHFQLPVAP
jgi:hypothetical protein